MEITLPQDLLDLMQNLLAFVDGKIIEIIIAAVTLFFSYRIAKKFRSKTADKSTQQTHSGTGDNIAGHQTNQTQTNSSGDQVARDKNQEIHHHHYPQKPLPPTTEKPPTLQIDGLTRLPETRAKLFGREKELTIINQAWANPKTHILVLEAFDGMGKTALLQTWLSQFIDTQSREVLTAETVYIWSFYSQGTAEDRQASAEPFLIDALKWFSHTGDLPISAHERGVALAKLIAAKRSLLVLDGVEPLQHPTGKVGGGLRDPGLKAMLRQLAMHNPGLVLISSRQPIVELKDQALTIHHPLEPLDDTAAAALFKAAKLSGTSVEFAAANQALQGHALSARSHAPAWECILCPKASVIMVN